MGGNSWLNATVKAESSSFQRSPSPYLAANCDRAMAGSSRCFTWRSARFNTSLPRARAYDPISGGPVRGGGGSARERVIIWHVPPREGQPIFLYFHGNGGSLRWRDERFRALIADGSGLVALSYRGYGGSSGRPTETGLIGEAATAYSFAVARYPAGRIVLWGESLGSALAIALAAA